MVRHQLAVLFMAHLTLGRRNAGSFAAPVTLGGNFLFLCKQCVAALAVGVTGVAVYGAGCGLFIAQLSAAGMLFGRKVTVFAATDFTGRKRMAGGLAAGAIRLVNVRVVECADAAVRAVAIADPCAPRTLGKDANFLEYDNPPVFCLP